MPIDVAPKTSAVVPISANIEAVRQEILKALAKLVPYHQEVKVLNQTRSCSVQLYVNGPVLIVEVKNEKEDETFRFEETKDNPKT